MSESVINDDDMGELSEPQLDDVVGDEALQQAVMFYDELELTFPPIPGDLGDQVRILGPGLLGTRDDLPTTYELDSFVTGLADSPGDYLIFGQHGYGMSSQALHYYVVRKNLALFVQVRWGGAYMDNAVAGRLHNGLIDLCTQLVTMAASGAVPDGQRLIVVQSDLADSRWGVVPDSQAADELTSAPNAIFHALSYLEEANDSANAMSSQPGIRV